EGHLLKRRAPQPAPGHEERDRLDEIGLTGTIGADEHHGPGMEVDARRTIAAKVRKRQPADAGGRNHAPIIAPPLKGRVITPASASAHKERPQRRDPGSMWGSRDRRA